ncbi:hypothetical protein Lbys_1914 [Leadbetterella byssophila DSM 17132]|uniref:Methylmalonyl-CoA mutase alpha/beta chain catalytic domain-containing protein n=1 Tax=Leadbetterella byssophila (strain DSM 17132 / JCM 16389 / KACC 11308 / NBRC 106382 / 4M15) TaxID=649349 RepID=E4RRS9_LEAB4|nr:methylmalonyl-CoA mutase family protein [Leadbetterella byssophila]ADQ17616.1 hypothetical protein Lbys_1914 [Leadbetterella byssophila DSM 17132]
MEWLQKVLSELPASPTFEVGNPLIDHTPTKALNIPKLQAHWLVSQWVDNKDEVLSSLQGGVQALSMKAETYSTLGDLDLSQKTIRIVGPSENLSPKGNLILCDEPRPQNFKGKWGIQGDHMVDLLIKAEKVVFQQKYGPVHFLLPAKENFYLNLAQMRTLRHLWAKIEEANQAQAGSCSFGVLLPCTGQDSYTEIIARTQMATSAICGGADWLEGEPIPGLEKEFARRLDRNIQHILRWEGHLGEVDDPASGSYFLEDLTIKMIEETWSTYLETYEKSLSSK